MLDLISNDGPRIDDVPLVYDYDQIDAAHRERVRANAASIKRNLKQAAVFAGNALTDTKTCLGHGQWLEWLETEFAWTERTAENLMNAARLVDKNEKFSILGDSIQYALGAPSTPEVAQVAVLTMAETKTGSGKGGRVTVEDAKQVIARHKPPQSRRLALPAHLAEYGCRIRQKDDRYYPFCPFAPELDSGETNTFRTEQEARTWLDERYAVYQARSTPPTQPTPPPPSPSPSPVAPPLLPPDLAASGWELRQLSGSGAWYCHNRSASKATGTYLETERAVAEAYTMQSELLRVADDSAYNRRMAAQILRNQYRSVLNSLDEYKSLVGADDRDWGDSVAVDLREMIRVLERVME